MAYNQSIDETRIGTTFPTNYTHSLSYFGETFQDVNSMTSYATSFHLVKDKYIDTHFGDSYTINVLFGATFGFTLPAWVSDITLETGDITSDQMTLTVADNKVNSGLMLGVILSTALRLQHRTWSDGYAKLNGFHSHWVSGHWNSWEGVDKQWDFDLFVDLVAGLRKVAGLIPKLSILNTMIPAGLGDKQIGAETTDIANPDGQYLDTAISLKWDFVKIGGILVRNGLEVAGMGTGPADAAIIAIIEIFTELYKVQKAVKILDIGCGPTMDLIFPIRLKISDLVAVDSSGNKYVYGDIEHSGDSDRRTLTGTNSSSVKIATNAPSDSIERVGMRFVQNLDIFNTIPGVWLKLSLLKIFTIDPSYSFNLPQEICELLGKDYMKLTSYNAELTNVIGGNIDMDGDAKNADVEFKFI